MDKKRGETKKNILVLTLVLLILFLVSPLISAAQNLSMEKTSLEKWEGNLSETERSILRENSLKYEQRILEEFAKIKYPEINQTSITGMNETTNETFIKIIIYLKDTSKADDLFSNFSTNELKDIIDRQISDRISVKITEEAFYKLIQDDRVDKIYFSRKGYFLLSQSADLINAVYAWDTLDYTGNGVKICVIDSGVDKYHPALSGKIIDEQCFCCSNFPNCGDNDDGCCSDGTAQDDSAEDDYGHGTHVAGIVASQDSTYKGVAPKIVF